MATYYLDASVGNDSNPGTSPGAGNAWATIGKAVATVSPSGGDIVYMKDSAVYPAGTALAFTSASLTLPHRFVGYTATIADGGRATIRATAAIALFTVGSSAYGLHFENLILDGNAVGTKALAITNNGVVSLSNCQIKTWTAEGITATGSYGIYLVGCDVTGCAGNAAIYYSGGGGVMVVAGSTIHGNATSGIGMASYGLNLVVVNSRIYGNTGASSDGISCIGLEPVIAGCTIHGNGRDGIRIVTYAGALARNNILTSNGGYGINYSGLSGALVNLVVDYNWFGSGSLANTSGARNTNLLAGPHDLSGDPGYANAGAGDFTPTNAAVQAGSA